MGDTFFVLHRNLHSRPSTRNLPSVHAKIVAPLTTMMIMTDDARNLINSPYGLNLAYAIGRYMPVSLGRRIADLIADYISARKTWKMVRAARCNQWVVHGERLTGQELNLAVRLNFRNIADAIYDLYHNIDTPTAFLRMIEPHPVAIQLVQRPEFAERGLVVAGVHLSNFDMVFQMGGLAGIQALVLTLPELSAGYRKQLEMRVKKGMQVVQASVGNIKHAIEHLKAGGMVITGIDRPDDSYVYRPIFFGRPAAVPIHHVFLALKAKVPILVGATIKRADGKYHFLFSDLIEMQPHPDRQTEILLNAERVLQQAEKIILHDPSQWSMTFPVWPDALDQCDIIGG
jgi:lauroyl/myristoyl acyltransferase